MEALPRSPWIIAIVLSFVIVEALWRLRSGKGYDFSASFASFGVAGVNFLIKPLSAAVMSFVFMGVWSVAPLQLPLDDWRVWAVAFLLVEFVYYWFHRWSHTIRWLWASHSVHHSASELTLPAAIRLGWTNLISGGWLLFAPLILLGFHPVMIAALLAGNLLYQFFLHTEAVRSLGPLEWVFNTPAHHRVHHASNAAYLDKNFGGVVIVWDRLFGSFAQESADEKPRYGLVHGSVSNNPIAIALHEWGRMAQDILAARSFKQAWIEAMGRPH